MCSNENQRSLEYLIGDSLHANKQPPITLYTVSEDKTKMWTVPEDEETASQHLSEQGTSKAEIVKKEKSPLEATFTSANRNISQPGDGVEVTVVAAKGKGIHSKAGKLKKTTDYTALEFISSSSQTNSVDTEDVDKEVDLEHIPEDEKIYTALTALMFEILRPLWSIAVTYWYYWSGNYTAAYIMTIVVLISGFCTHLVYFISRTSPIRKIWKSSKFISLLCAIPFALPIILALCNCVFSLKESRSRMYERPWTNTFSVFMVGSLTLAFPQCVLQMSILLEHYVEFPSIPGFALLLGILMFSVDITFSRVRHDAHKRCDRFGEKLEKLCRYIYIWLIKVEVLWFSTYSIVIVSLRQCYPDPHQLPVATAVSAAGIFFVHEIMVIIAVLPFFRRVVQSMVGLFFIFPQFVSLLALIIWVNTDKTIYDTNIGSFFLGVVFWGECIILAGWLFDRGLGKEPDFLPAYPHFTGDVFSYCCQSN
ncbi:hypothetical protein Ocin01_01337 [Orchesella cincta]|uniref:Transmembrane protein n=1 Tax=Orchesella cincta TaxID=48709 RepID=A0A1D2NK66_ORCCI|nr:hypothetical protein Ocin01_01337 [Orchesella cincta]